MSVAEEYARRLAAREAEVARCARLHERIGGGRVALGVVALVVAWLAFFQRACNPLWLLLPLVGLVALIVRHAAVRRLRSRAERAAAYYRHGIARLEDRWSGLGQTGERFASHSHLYAADLDLFGKGSLFELLSVARTRMGEDTLARWLLAPAASIAEIHARQGSVLDLRERLDLREELAVLGDDPQVGVQPEALLDWAEAPNELTQRWLLPVALVLPLLALAGVVVWSLWSLALPLVLVILAAVLVNRAVQAALAKAIYGSEHAFADLQLLAQMLLRIEQVGFDSVPLQNLVRRLSSHTLPASVTMARLARVVDYAQARSNPILRLLDMPLMYSVQVALAAERWRREHGRVVREWVEALGELEALVSLAGYSHEHPGDPFPEVVAGPAMFAAVELGHPLLPAAQCVRNSIAIEGATRVLIVSGSNMSGKSTLLRTVGVNTVLAMAGAPVRARQLRLSRLQVGASIRINDSLQEGSSRFYSEITRLRALHGLLERELPLLFLIDEMLQGTNSQDRLAGAQGVVRAFLAGGAIGLVSTHDLALTQLSGAAPGTVRNVHFQDELIEGRMRFDFTLREGVVTKSNGIELMRAIGLKV